MIKRFLLLAGMALTLATGLGLSSCSDDDDDVLSEDQIRKIIADEVVKQSAGTNNSSSITREDVEKIVAGYMSDHKTEALSSEDVKKIVDEIVAKQETGSDNSSSLTKEDVEKIVANYMSDHKTEALSSDDVKKIVDEIVAKQETGSDNSSSLTKEDIEKIVADYMSNHKTESLTSDDVKKIVDEIIAKQEAGSGNSNPKYDVTDDGFTVVPLEKLEDFFFYNIGKKKELYVEVSGITNDNFDEFDFDFDFDLFDLHLKLPNSITVLEGDYHNMVFECSYTLKELIVPSSVKEVNGTMCLNCRKLQSVKFLGKVETFKTGSYGDHFEECKALEKIEVPKAYVDYYKEVFPTVKDLIVGF